MYDFIGNPLALLEICLQASELTTQVDVPTWVEMRDKSKLLDSVNKNQPTVIGNLLDRILLTDNPSIGLILARETHLLKYIIPELDLCYSVGQTRKTATMDVFTHTMLALEASEKTDYIRWSVLFHDIGKPETFELTETGQIHFFKHEIVGARIARQYLRRYKRDQAFVDKVVSLITHHMFDADPKLTPKGVRRLIRRAGKDNIYDLLKIREADRKGTINPPSMQKIELLKSKIDKEISYVS
jgi:tRNA nucleotidyltransferase (CCA-adding enzyme)